MASLALQVGLALLALADVEDVALRAHGLAGVVAHEHALVAYPCHAAVGPHDAVLDHRLLSGDEHARRLRQHALAIVGVQDALEEVGAREPSPRACIRAVRSSAG